MGKNSQNAYSANKNTTEYKEINTKKFKDDMSFVYLTLKDEVSYDVLRDLAPVMQFAQAARESNYEIPEKLEAKKADVTLKKLVEIEEGSLTKTDYESMKLKAKETLAKQSLVSPSYNNKKINDIKTQAGKTLKPLETIKMAGQPDSNIITAKAEETLTKWVAMNAGRFTFPDWEKLKSEVGITLTKQEAIPSNKLWNPDSVSVKFKETLEKQNAITVKTMGNVDFVSVIAAMTLKKMEAVDTASIVKVESIEAKETLNSQEPVAVKTFHGAGSLNAVETLKKQKPVMVKNFGRVDSPNVAETLKKQELVAVKTFHGADSLNAAETLKKQEPVTVKTFHGAGSLNAVETLKKQKPVMVKNFGRADSPNVAETLKKQELVAVKTFHGANSLNAVDTLKKQTPVAVKVFLSIDVSPIAAEKTLSRLSEFKKAYPGNPASVTVKLTVKQILEMESIKEDFYKGTDFEKMTVRRRPTLNAPVVLRAEKLYVIANPEKLNKKVEKTLEKQALDSVNLIGKTNLEIKAVEGFRKLPTAKVFVPATVKLENGEIVPIVVNAGNRPVIREMDLSIEVQEIPLKLEEENLNKDWNSFVEDYIAYLKTLKQNQMKEFEIPKKPVSAISYWEQCGGMEAFFQELKNK